MDSGFYAACAGLRAQSQALEVSAHNLANLNTAGFRGQQTNFRSLVALPGTLPGTAAGAPSSATGALSSLASGEATPLSYALLTSRLNLAANDFGVLEGSHLDLTAGNLVATGNPLDVAIEGSGFFAVETPRGARYTRNGSFQVSSAGQLVTDAGDLVLGGLPPKPGAVTIPSINVPAGPVTIAPDGTISVNGAVAGRIQLVDFVPGTEITSEGGSLLAAPEGSAQAAAKSSLKQGALESSNVNPISSVVRLIGVQREAEMMQRCMSLFDTEFNRIAASDLPKI